jgi:HD-GYP domain-containing protein (c-di-GMP phosphodiesterase class II)
MSLLASYGLVLPALLGEAIFLALLSQRQLSRSQREGRAVIESLHLALLERDPYTHYHSVRVTQYVAMMLDQLPSLSPDAKATILNAARIHDLGKVAIPDQALGKAGKLTQADWALMQRHPQIGEDIVRPLHEYRESATLVRHHHERWDGTGYPDGLAGHAIPFGSRVIAVADAFDAMTSDRVYRPALPVSVALDELRRQAGRQFDPAIVRLFERSLQMSNTDLPSSHSESEPFTSLTQAGAAD